MTAAEKLLEEIADMELCDDPAKQEPCTFESGPYCGAHDYFALVEIVKKARAILGRSQEKTA